MKKAIILSAVTVILCLSSLLLTNAQALKRIQFGKGKSSAVIKGTTGKYGITYVLRARSGQKLIVNLSPALKVGIKIETDGRYGHEVLLREERGGRYEVGLEEAGDYTIFVGSLNNQPVPFTLTVSVTNLTDI